MFLASKGQDAHADHLFKVHILFFRFILIIINNSKNVQHSLQLLVENIFDAVYFFGFWFAEVLDKDVSHDLSFEEFSGIGHVAAEIIGSIF